MSNKQQGANGGGSGAPEDAKTPRTDNLGRDEMHAGNADLHAGVTSSGGSRRIGALSELSQSIAPGRDLWPSIEAALREEAARTSNQHTKRYKPSGLQIMAAAAVIAALAVGIWIGRSSLPTGSAAIGTPPVAANNPQSQPQKAVTAAFVTDPRYLKQREALMRSHDAELEKLPPETRAKVAASLATIRRSMQELEDALGRDPSNALLQELLVNTYQDEMRVLTTVQEAGAREI